MNVLLIEDDKDTRIAMIGILDDAGMKVTATGLGEEGVTLAKNHRYDIILLDINLPDISGYKVLESLRMNKIQTPVTVVSGMSGMEDKVRALGFGADDYMTKPFQEGELINRTKAIVERSQGRKKTMGPMVINLDMKTVDVDGERVSLTGKEYQVIEFMATKPNNFSVTREMLHSHLYGETDEIILERIDVVLSELSEKLNVANPEVQAGKFIQLKDGAVLVSRDMGDSEKTPVATAFGRQGAKPQSNGGIGTLKSVLRL